MKKDFRKMVDEIDHRASLAQLRNPLPAIGMCGFCDRKFLLNELQDNFAITEFITSGLCQKCQDKTAEEGK